MAGVTGNPVTDTTELGGNPRRTTNQSVTLDVEGEADQFPQRHVRRRKAAADDIDRYRELARLIRFDRGDLEGWLLTPQPDGPERQESDQRSGTGS